MNSIISNDDRIAIAEVDYIIHHMDEKYLNKIPTKILDYITILKKKDIEIKIDPKIPLEKQGLREFTLYFIIILNLKYWCNDERRKEILAMMENNQRIFEEKVNTFFEEAESIQGDKNTKSDFNENKDIEKPILTESYSKNNFENRNEKSSNLAVNKQEYNFFQKILYKIKSVIKK